MIAVIAIIIITNAIVFFVLVNRRATALFDNSQVVLCVLFFLFNFFCFFLLLFFCMTLAVVSDCTCWGFDCVRWKSASTADLEAPRRIVLYASCFSANKISFKAAHHECTYERRDAGQRALETGAFFPSTASGRRASIIYQELRAFIYDRALNITKTKYFW